MSEERSALKAPFPYFGGKRRVAHVVWARFGNVPNYAEPFFGSGAVLLARPHAPRVETVNDKDCLIANFWRAVQAAPDLVAENASWPVNEADLHARHEWIVETVDDEWRERMHHDPRFFDALIASWWLWGLSCWIGGGWCPQTGNLSQKLPLVGGTGTGVNRAHLAQGIPHISDQGTGVHAPHLAQSMPMIGGPGQGINRGALIEGEGTCAERLAALKRYFGLLQDRLRNVRVCCGEWDRILGPSPTHKIGITGVFLDPPYGGDEMCEVYSHDSADVASAVRQWCAENGDHPDLRIALCGYDGEHNALETHGWSVHAWKATGGWANTGEGQGQENCRKERIWFSPACREARDGLQGSLV
ncbi:MAG: DNA adenine methylase [Gemmatimonadota bacterium]